MNKLSEKKLDKEFFLSFRKWVNFNMESLTWQGRYRKEFEEFWVAFFSDGMLISDTILRFDYSCKAVKVGPLVSWFTWLRKKFLCYVFINLDCSVLELSKVTNISINNLSFILREFFVEKYPHLDEYFSENFQMSSLVSSNIHLTISQIKETVELDLLEVGSIEDEVLPSMEVTLYEEWIVLLHKIKNDFSGSEVEIKNISVKSNIIKSFKIFRDVTLLLFFTFGVIWLIKNGNEYYEKYLLDKISVYEPQFKWLNKSLTFKQIPTTEISNARVEYDIDEAQPEALSKEQEAEMVEEIFKPESEVMVTSWDSLPRDINVANLEQSDYEEKQGTGYREYRYGRNKVFRVLLKTSDFIESRKKLNILSDKFQVEQVDNVTPGKLVPGGAYYNLYVPRASLKEFLAKVMEQDAGVLYESKTRSKRNPPGKNKVFIWVKSI